MRSIQETVKNKPWLGWVIFLATVVVVFMLGMFASLGYNQEIPYPDISTKAKAQEFIGLDMEKHNEEKKVFLETVLPGWAEAANEREKSYDPKK